MVFKKYTFLFGLSLQLFSTTCLADGSLFTQNAFVYDNLSQDVAPPPVLVPIEEDSNLDSTQDNSIKAAIAFENWFILYKTSFQEPSYFKTILRRSNEYINSLRDPKVLEQKKIWDKYEKLVEAYTQNSSTNIDNFTEKIKSYNQAIRDQAFDRLTIAKKYHDVALGYLEKINANVHPELHAAAAEYEKNAKEYAKTIQQHGVSHSSVKEIHKKLLSSHQALLSEYNRTANWNISATKIQRLYKNNLNSRASNKDGNGELNKSNEKLGKDEPFHPKSTHLPSSGQPISLSSSLVPLVQKGNRGVENSRGKNHLSHSDNTSISPVTIENSKEATEGVKETLELLVQNVASLSSNSTQSQNFLSSKGKGSEEEKIEGSGKGVINPDRFSEAIPLPNSGSISNSKKTSISEGTPIQTISVQAQEKESSTPSVASDSDDQKRQSIGSVARVSPRKSEHLTQMSDPSKSDTDENRGKNNVSASKSDLQTFEQNINGSTSKALDLERSSELGTPRQPPPFQGQENKSSTPRLASDSDDQKRDSIGSEARVSPRNLEELTQLLNPSKSNADENRGKTNGTATPSDPQTLGQNDEGSTSEARELERSSELKTPRQEQPVQGQERRSPTPSVASDGDHERHSTRSIDEPVSPSNLVDLTQLLDPLKSNADENRGKTNGTATPSDPQTLGQNDKGSPSEVRDLERSSVTGTPRQEQPVQGQERRSSTPSVASDGDHERHSTRSIEEPVSPRNLVDLTQLLDPLKSNSDENRGKTNGTAIPNDQQTLGQKDKGSTSEARELERSSELKTPRQEQPVQGQERRSSTPSVASDSDHERHSTKSKDSPVSPRNLVDLTQLLDPLKSNSDENRGKTNGTATPSDPQTLGQNDKGSTSEARELERSSELKTPRQEQPVQGQERRSSTSSVASDSDHERQSTKSIEEPVSPRNLEELTQLLDPSKSNSDENRGKTNGTATPSDPQTLGQNDKGSTSEARELERSSVSGTPRQEQPVQGQERRSSTPSVASDSDHERQSTKSIEEPVSPRNLEELTQLLDPSKSNSDENRGKTNGTATPSDPQTLGQNDKGSPSEVRELERSSVSGTPRQEQPVQGQERRSSTPSVASDSDHKRHSTKSKDGPVSHRNLEELTQLWDPSKSNSDENRGQNNVTASKSDPQASGQNSKVFTSGTLDFVESPESETQKQLQFSRTQQNKIQIPKLDLKILSDQRVTSKKSVHPISSTKSENRDKLRGARVKGLDQKKDSQSDQIDIKQREKNKRVNSEFKFIQSLITKNLEYSRALEVEVRSIKAQYEEMRINPQEPNSKSAFNKYTKLLEKKLNILNQNTRKVSQQLDDLESQLQESSKRIDDLRDERVDAQQNQKLTEIQTQLGQARKYKNKLNKLSRGLFELEGVISSQFLPIPPPKKSEKLLEPQEEKLNPREPINTESNLERGLSNESFHPFQEKLQELQDRFDQHNNQSETLGDISQKYNDEFTEINQISSPREKKSAASRFKTKLETSKSYGDMKELIEALGRHHDDLNELENKSKIWNPDTVQLLTNKNQLSKNVTQLKGKNVHLSSKLEAVTKIMDSLYNENRKNINTLVKDRNENVIREIESIYRMIRDPIPIRPDCESEGEKQANDGKTCLDLLKNHESILLSIKNKFNNINEEKLKHLTTDYGDLGYLYENHSQQALRTQYHELGNKLNEIKRKMNKNPPEVPNVMDELAKLQPEIKIREMNMEFPILITSSERLLNFATLVQNKANKLQAILSLGYRSSEMEQEVKLILAQFDSQTENELLWLTQQTGEKSKQLSSQVNILKNLFNNQSKPTVIQHVIKMGSDQFVGMTNMSENLVVATGKVHSSILSIRSYFSSHKEHEDLLNKLNALIVSKKDQMRERAAAIESSGDAGPLANLVSNCKTLQERTNLSISAVVDKQRSKIAKNKQYNDLNQSFLDLQKKYDETIGNLEKEEERELSELMAEIREKGKTNTVIHAKMITFEHLIEQAREDKPENVKFYRQNLNQVKNLIDDFQRKASITGESEVPPEEPSVEIVKDEKLIDRSSEAPSALQGSPDENCLTRAKEGRDLISRLRDIKIDKAMGTINTSSEDSLVSQINNSINELTELCNKITPDYFKSKYNLINYSINDLIWDLKKDFRMIQGLASDPVEHAVFIVRRSNHLGNDSIQRLDLVLGTMPKISKTIQDWADQNQLVERSSTGKSPSAQSVRAVDSRALCTNIPGVPFSSFQTKSLADGQRVVSSLSKSKPKPKPKPPSKRKKSS